MLPRHRRGGREEIGWGHTLQWEGGKKISVSEETQALENFMSM